MIQDIVFSVFIVVFSLIGIYQVTSFRTIGLISMLVLFIVSITSASLLFWWSFGSSFLMMLLWGYIFVKDR
jgi:hypothetical protein